MLPLAPGRGSSMTCCPDACVKNWPTVRAIRSLPPPAGVPITIRIGFVGKVLCAGAIALNAYKMRAVTARMGCRIIPLLCRMPGCNRSDRRVVDCDTVGNELVDFIG